MQVDFPKFQVLLYYNFVMAQVVDFTHRVNSYPCRILLSTLNDNKENLGIVIGIIERAIS